MLKLKSLLRNERVQYWGYRVLCIIMIIAMGYILTHVTAFDPADH